MRNVFAQIRIAAIVSTAPVVIVAASSNPAEAFNFSHIYAFGDSLSDTGSTFNTTGGTFPPSLLYPGGRFSNGPVWLEYLAPRLGAPLTSFAFGGATTGTVNTTIPFLPALQSQISSFVSANPVADPNALYVVWAGANDYLGAGVQQPSEPISNLTNAVLSLTGIGARNILVANLPDLGQLPGSRNTDNAPGLTFLSNAHNQLLSATIAALRPTVQPDVNLIPLDINFLVTDAIAHPSTYGFTNAINSCLFTACTTPDTYLFWDNLHPTTAGHEQIAEFAFSTLNAQAVPEPVSTLGVLMAGALMGGLGALKRKSACKL
ncbi:MAG TPA: SGNH/GDSL hydrolase family protein [Microcoleaceae cyanobacterium]|jgi:phospholipase/lecithinase/hemolysin